MCKIREKMKSYPVGTVVIVTCSDEPEKDYLGILGKNLRGEVCVIFDDGCYYYPDDNDNVRFVDNYSRLMNI